MEKEKEPEEPLAPELESALREYATEHGTTLEEMARAAAEHKRGAKKDDPPTD